MSEKQPSEVTPDALRFAADVMELPADMQEKILRLCELCAEHADDEVFVRRFAKLNKQGARVDEGLAALDRPGD